MLRLVVERLQQLIESFETAMGRPTIPGQSVISLLEVIAAKPVNV